MSLGNTELKLNILLLQGLLGAFNMLFWVENLKEYFM